MLKRIVYRSIKNIAIALYGRQPAYPNCPGYEETQLVQRVYRWGMGMPFFERVQVKALFVAFYFFSLLYQLLFRAGPASPAKLLSAMLASRFRLVYFIATSLKGIFSMHYMSAYQALAYFNVHKRIKYPHDKERVPLLHLTLAKGNHRRAKHRAAV